MAVLKNIRAGEKYEETPDPGYVYLIQPVGHNVTTIGCSANVERRLAAIQRELDVQLCIVHRFFARNYQLAEDWLQRKYRRYRLSNDRFALPDDALEAICQIGDEK